MHTYSTNDARANAFFLRGSSGIKIYFNYDMVYLYVNSAGNVSVGNTQEEWVVIKTNSDYLIVLASNPMLALTRTSSGIVVQQLEAHNTNQTWEICRGTQAQFEYHYIDSGIYYINSDYTKKFMIADETGKLKMAGGKETDLGNQMAWDISFVGNGKYTIRSLEYPNKYLHVTTYQTYLFEIDTAIPDRALFTIQPANGGYTIRSAATDSYLTAESEKPSSEQNYVDKARWRLCEKEDYNEVVLAEVTDYSVLMLSDYYPNITETTASSYTYSTLSSDFTYTSSNTDAAYFGSTTVIYGQRTDGYTNVTSVTATHIPTGQQVSYRLWVEDAIWCFKTSSVRLSAESASSITVTTSKGSTKEGFGKQLWYTEYAESVNGTKYYYIHSLHVRDDSGCDNNLLTYNGTNLSLKEKGTVSDSKTQEWSFIKNGNFYFIKNRASGKYLKASGTSNNASVTMSTSSYTWSLEGIEALNLPECNWQCGYEDSNDAHDIYIKIDGSINELPNSSVWKELLKTPSYYDEIFGVWNGISKNINIHVLGASETAPNGAYTINLYVSGLVTTDDVPLWDIVGVTFGNGMEGSDDDQWVYTDIYLNYYFEIIEDKSYLIQLMKETIVHEIGHALKLSHVFTEETDIRYYTTYSSYAFEAEVLSCMNYSAIDESGNPLTATFDTSVPTFIDRYNLIRKWDV